jgi:hypothetical protein
MAQHWAMHTPLCQGGKVTLAVALPLPQHCKLLAHEEATLPCVSLCDSNVIVTIAMAIAIAIVVALSITIAIVIAITVAIGHCHRCCRRSLSSPLPLAIDVAIAITVVIDVTIAIAVSIDHSRCHHCQSCHCKHHLPWKRRRHSLESCCLGAVTIIFK